MIHICTSTSNQNMIHKNFKLSRSAIVSLENDWHKIKVIQILYFSQKKIKGKKTGFAVSLQSKKVFFFWNSKQRYCLSSINLKWCNRFTYDWGVPCFVCSGAHHRFDETGEEDDDDDDGRDVFPHNQPVIVRSLASHQLDIITKSGIRIELFIINCQLHCINSYNFKTV